MKKPPEPGGKLTKSPGLRRTNRTAGTIRSAFVSVRPIALEMIQYDMTKIRALISTLCTDVFMSVKIPGLRTTNKKHGINNFSIIVTDYKDF
jgi:hypothetical protein